MKRLFLGFLPLSLRKNIEARSSFFFSLFSMGKKKSTTNAEASHAVIKATKPLEKGEREPEDVLETKVNLKKQKKSKEEKPEKPAKDDEEEEALPPVKIATSSDSHLRQSGVETVYVKGFDTSLSEDDINRAMWKHFGSCGQITQVYVPKDETGAIKGFAYVDIMEGVKKALELNGSDMRGSKLVVEKVILEDSYRFGGVGRRNLQVGGPYAGGRCGGYGYCRPVC